MRVLLMDTRPILSVQSQYYLLEEDCGPLENYGVRITYGATEAQVPGVTFSASEIIRLLCTLVESSVTPVTLRDVVDDWLLRE